MTDSSEIILKIIILGSSQVGKTSIINRYFNNQFNGNMLSTIGIDFKTKYFKFDGQKVKFTYIDTAGQEKFRAISLNYLKGTNGAILVFDITKKETFELIKGWIKELNENNKSTIGKILFGNKSDLSNNREVEIEDAENLAQDLGCIYYEGSAKTGENITEALDEIAKISYDNYQNLNESEKRHSLRLSENPNNEKEDEKKEKKKKKCC